MATLDSDDLTAISGLIDARLAAYGVSTYSGGTVPANMISINGTVFSGPTVPSDRLMFSGVLGSQSLGDVDSVVLPSGPSDNSVLIGSRIRIISGVGQYQERTVSSWDGTTKIAGIDTPFLAVTPASGDGFQILYDHSYLTDGSSNVLGVATVSAFRSTALGQLFNVDSGQVYADAVPGSVVQEIATHGTAGVVNANIVSINSNATAAVNLAAQLLAQFNGVVSADATATPTSFSANTSSSPGLSPVIGKYVNSVIAFYNGVQAPLARKITSYSYSGGVGTFTISLPLDAPPATDGSALFIILGYAP